MARPAHWRTPGATMARPARPAATDDVAMPAQDGAGIVRSGAGHRHAPRCPHGQSCRTGRRSDCRLLPSLSRATPSAVSEHSSELIGCPISRSLTTYCVRLELRPLPSTGVIRLQRYCEPLRRPRAPDLSLAGVRLVIADHALGLPVLRALSLCTCCRHYPGAAAGRLASLASPSRVSLPRYGGRVGLRIVLFEVCSAFTALRPAHSRCHRIS